MEVDDYFRGPYLSTIEENGALRPGIEHIYGEIVRHLGTYLRPGRLLDVGCAMGHFMVYAREFGWEVQGVECSGYAAAYGREKYGLQVQAACELRKARLRERQFDACVLIEVAEHLPFPRETFKEVFRLLKPGGVIYVTTPNFASYRAQLERENWHAIIPKGHLYYFTAETLTNMLNSLGFTGAVDLSARAEFEVELENSRALNRLWASPPEIEAIRERAEREDADKLFNGRGEGLTIWAVKPHSARDGVKASLRNGGGAGSLEGKLVRRPGERTEDQMVYYVWRGRKHWVTSVEWLHRRGMRLEDTIEIHAEQLESVLLGEALI